MVASCRLPLGIPSRSLLPTGHLSANRNRPRKAAYCAFVAHQAVAFHLHAKQQRVIVAVGRGRNHAETVAAGFALHPELLAGAAPEGYKAGFSGFFVAGWI